MKQHEFTQRARKERLTGHYVRYDNGFSERSSIIGCTQIDDLWYIYETDEVGNKIVRMISNDEDKTFDKFYDFILRKMSKKNRLAVN